MFGCGSIGCAKHEETVAFIAVSSRLGRYGSAIPIARAEATVDTNMSGVEIPLLILDCLGPAISQWTNSPSETGLVIFEDSLQRNLVESALRQMFEAPQQSARTVFLDRGLGVWVVLPSGSNGVFGIRRVDAQNVRIRKGPTSPYSKK